MADENEVTETTTEDLPEQLEEEIKEIFQKIDKNGNGYIEASELVLVLRGLGQNPTDEEVAEGLKSMDRNNDDVITLDEFRKFITENPLKSAETQKKDLLDAFNHFDRNKDGFVVEAELREALSKGDNPMSAEDIEEMFQLVDKNGDGKINIQEFTQLLLELSDES